MIRRNLLAVFAAAICLCAATQSHAQLSGFDVKCRYKIANAGRFYLRNLLQRVSTCHQKRARGKLPAAIDCNDPSTWSANGYAKASLQMQKSFERTMRHANSCRPTGGTPASVGYIDCPAPCDGIAIATFDDVASCRRCMVENCLLDAADQLLGTAPLPMTYETRRCQNILGRKLHHYTQKRDYLLAWCQYNQEQGKPAFQGIDCLDVDNPANTAHFLHTRALFDMTHKITNQCGPIDMVGEMDSCGTDAASAITCLLGLAQQCTEDLFAANFPPVP